MNTRRDFLKKLVLLGSMAGGANLALGRTTGPVRRPVSAVRYTGKVREVTRGLKIRPGRWKWIVAHHSATPEGNARIYDRAHRQRGMENGLAYHFLIGNGVDSKDGEIEIGSRWLKQLLGGHVRRDEINEVGIGICLVGNFERKSPSPAQLAAFTELVDYLREEVVGRKVRFAVHREIDPGRTVCPGRYFPIKQMHRRYG
jgi:hypothetical protein